MIFAQSRESWNNSSEGSVNGPILLTGALNWKSADNLSVNISYFKADHFSRNTRLMFLFVILNLHLLDSRSWGEEEKQQLVVKGCWSEESSPIPPSPTVTSAPAWNGEKRGWHFPRPGSETFSDGHEPQWSPPGWQWPMQYGPPLPKNAQTGKRSKRNPRGVGGREKPKISLGDSSRCFASFSLGRCLKYKCDCGLLLHKKAIGTGFL